MEHLVDAVLLAHLSLHFDEPAGHARKVVEPIQILCPYFAMRVSFFSHKDWVGSVGMSTMTEHMA